MSSNNDYHAYTMPPRRVVTRLRRESVTPGPVAQASVRAQSTATQGVFAARHGGTHCDDAPGRCRMLDRHTAPTRRCEHEHSSTRWQISRSAIRRQPLMYTNNERDDISATRVRVEAAQPCADATTTRSPMQCRR